MSCVHDMTVSSSTYRLINPSCCNSNLFSYLPGVLPRHNLLCIAQNFCTTVCIILAHRLLFVHTGC
ncbi:hypothetical protein BDW75DRAFT_221851 [Aspergillus navahoensis]